MYRSISLPSNKIKHMRSVVSYKNVSSKIPFKRIILEKYKYAVQRGDGSVNLTRTLHFTKCAIIKV